MIILEGNPISTQHAYGQHGKIRYMKKDAKDLKQRYIDSAYRQYKEKVTDEELEIMVRLFFKDRRVRDWDNFHKISIDSLTGIVWEDDNQIKKATVELFYDKLNPRIEIEIWKYRKPQDSSQESGGKA